ncbi:uncharacterized protein KZ484_025288 [Pholidichthys leucotaenia]
MKEEQEELCTNPETDLLVVKLETDAFMETSVYEENEQSEAGPIGEQQDEEGSQHEPRTKRCLTNRSPSNGDDDCLTSGCGHETDAPQLDDCKDKKVLIVQQLWDQERNPSVDQEEQHAGEVKVEEEQLYVTREEEEIEQETDAFMVTPAFEENNSKTDSDGEQLLSHKSPDTESKNQGAATNINLGSNQHEEPKKSQMKEHHRSHIVVRKIVCDYCGKRFSQRESLINHMSVHTSEKPFCCETCGQRFTQSSSLNRHIRVHTDASQLHDYKAKEVLSVYPLWNQERNSCLHQEDQDAAQSKREVEGLCSKLVQDLLCLMKRTQGIPQPSSLPQSRRRRNADGDRQFL